MSKHTAEVVICGAGIAGVAAAYHLAVKRGLKNVVLVEQGDPLSLTSDKSSEAYRNWWPGPDGQMIALMNRSIELLEGLARASANRINLNRRGYLFATAEESKISLLAQSAEQAAHQGAGALRVHTGQATTYRPSLPEGLEGALDGADLLTGAAIHRHFPYLSPRTKAVLHVRRAGWLSAQQLGMYLLEQAREHGARLVRGQVVGVETAGGAVREVHVRQTDGSLFAIQTPVFVNAAGPFQHAVGRLLGVELPVFAELHRKMSFSEALGVVPREAPMLIWMDEVELPFSPEEREILAQEESTRWLLGRLPSGVHGRPDGHGASTTLIVLYNYHTQPVEPTFPLPPEPHYPEIALRGMSVMIPGLRQYFEKTPKPWVDGGYYLKTQENRPLIGPLPVKGAYIIGALSGFGVMAACAAGELLAAHVTGAALPGYAPAFLLSRYQDPVYQQQLRDWGDTSQL